MTASGPSNRAKLPTSILQPIAVARSYHALRAAIAAWCASTRLTRAQLDAKAGLADGHSSKLLSARAVKKFGNQSFGPVLSATGLAILVVQDDEAVELIEQQLNASEIASAPPKHWRTAKGKAWARRMNGRRVLLLPAKRRSEIARKAAEARWRRRSSDPA